MCHVLLGCASSSGPVGPLSPALYTRWALSNLECRTQGRKPSSLLEGVRDPWETEGHSCPMQSVAPGGFSLRHPGWEWSSAELKADDELQV